MRIYLANIFLPLTGSHSLMFFSFTQSRIAREDYPNNKNKQRQYQRALRHHDIHSQVIAVLKNQHPGPVPREVQTATSILLSGELHSAWEILARVSRTKMFPAYLLDMPALWKVIIMNLELVCSPPVYSCCCTPEHLCIGIIRSIDLMAVGDCLWGVGFVNTN